MSDASVALATEDSPRSAYVVLERRATLTTVGVLLGLAGLSWWSTVHRAGGMTAMVQGFAHVGTAMPFDMAVPVFMAMWVTMMVAMMFPTIAPIVLVHRMVLRRRQAGVWPTVAFGSGYLLIWAVVGLVPLSILVGFRHASSGSLWVLRAGGAVLVVAGAYQFTRWKETCLRTCRTPLHFLMTHDFGTGPLGAGRVGIAHGLYCLGCCWALMAVLFVVGLMNLTWMAAIAVVLLAEKNWRHGVALTKVVGVCLVAFGIGVLLHPSLLDSVTPLARASTSMTGG
jgi:predicted metal-binding membrane protein